MYKFLLKLVFSIFIVFSLISTVFSQTTLDLGKEVKIIYDENLINLSKSDFSYSYGPENFDFNEISSYNNYLLNLQYTKEIQEGIHFEIEVVSERQDPEEMIKVYELKNENLLDTTSIEDIDFIKISNANPSKYIISYSNSKQREEVVLNNEINSNNNVKNNPESFDILDLIAKTIGYIVIFIALVLLSIFIFKKLHKLKPKRDEKKILYKKTRKYVKEYKNSYDKQGIRQSLENANVPKEIIDYVFFEEFKK